MAGREWLALLAGTVPAERLAATRLIVTPGTILRWQRDIVRRRRARLSCRGRCGRPATHRQVRSAVLRLARENESQGYRRIHGELAGSASRWRRPRSGRSSRAPGPTGLRAELAGVPLGLGAGDPGAGLVHRRPAQRHEGLRPCRHRDGTRRIQILGATGHPVPSQVVQQARNLLMDLEDAGTPAKFVLHDRDASFTATFDSVFQAAGIRVTRSAVQAPQMNSVMERWISSCRRQRHLMIVLREYEDSCNTRRPHRTLNRAAPLRPLLDGVTDPDQFRVQRRDRAGGVIHEYRLVA